MFIISSGSSLAALAGPSILLYLRNLSERKSIDKLLEVRDFHDSFGFVHTTTQYTHTHINNNNRQQQQQQQQQQQTTTTTTTTTTDNNNNNNNNNRQQQQTTNNKQTTTTTNNHTHAVLTLNLLLFFADRGPGQVRGALRRAHERRIAAD